RRKDSRRGAETPEVSVGLGDYSASHFEGSALNRTGLHPLGNNNQFHGLTPNPKVSGLPWRDQACGRCSATDVAEHGLPRAQGLASPIETDMTEQPMLNGMPLRAAGRIVADGHRQAKPVTHLGLQLVFPLPWAAPITAPRIRQDQELVGRWEYPTTFGLPPAG